MNKTTPKYWNCECEDHYIKPAVMNSCTVCGALREYQPDSRVDEVIPALKTELAGLNCAIDRVECFGARDVVRRERIRQELEELERRE